jgi:drug/metabolite transporter (DMT)-like permease
MRKNKGIIFALIASIISGIAIFYSKISLIKVDPLVLTTSRNLYVGVLFIFLFLSKNKLKEIKSLSKKDLISLIVIGIIGGAIPFCLFFTGLKFASSALTVNFIHKTLFIWVLILGGLFFKEKVRPLYLVSFVLIFFGNLLITPKSISIGRGELMVFAATLLWSVEYILAKQVLKNVSSEMIGLFRMGTGSLILLLTTVAMGKGGLMLGLGLGELTIIGIGGTILFFYVSAWYKALKYAPASLVTMILTFSVVVGNVLNGSFTGIKIMQKEVYSSLLISAAAVVLLIQSLRQKFQRNG